MARKDKWVLVSPDGNEHSTSDARLYWRLLGQGYTVRGQSGAASADESAPPAAEGEDTEAKPKTTKRRSPKNKEST